MAEVNFRNVSKQYGRSPRVIHGFHLDVGHGEFLVLVGPSGCGKSTTLRMLAGLEAITEGEILIDGRRVNEVHPRDRDIAMVFQNYALYPHMSVYQNMALNLKIRKVPREEIARRVKYVAGVLGIDELLDRSPSELSGGQKQRVAVGRAIVREPKVFLFDEPLSNLDAKLRVQMRAEIGALHKRLNATMVYVTHDQVEAMTLGTRVVVMRDGHIQQVAAPLDLFNEPANMFVAGFIGSPPMNFVAGTLRRDPSPHFANRDSSLICNVADTLSGWQGDIILGIRPEHLRLGADGDCGFAALATRIEPLGSELIVYLDVGPDKLVGRMPADAPVSEGRLRLACPAERLRFFDPKTQQRFAAPMR
jgi:ABC-type sugar transport system ATPase subunit